MSNEEIVLQIQNGIDVTENQEKLWLKNKGFVNYMIKKTCGFSEDIEDLEQQGFIGLVTAAMKYKPDNGANFITFAGYHIRSSIIRYNENCCHCVRTPTYLLSRIRKYEQMRQQYRNDKGREPTDDEYMELLHISHRSLLHLEKTMHNMRAISINMDLSQSDGETSLLDMLRSDEDIEELITYSVYNKELKKALDSSLALLDHETSAMIQSVYYQGNSMRKTAEIFGCAVQNVSDRIRAGFWKILHSSHRKALESFMWDGYQYNEYLYSEYAETEDEENEFLI